MSSNEQRRARVDTEIAAPLREASPDVDELHRARLVSAIDAALDREDSARDIRRRSGITEGPRRRWRARCSGEAPGAISVSSWRSSSGSLRPRPRRRRSRCSYATFRTIRCR